MRALRRRYGRSSAKTLACDMKNDCKDHVTHIDNKGFVYCSSHGAQRRMNGTPCRKMSRAEIKRLEEGGTISYTRHKKV